MCEFVAWSNQNSKAISKALEEHDCGILYVFWPFLKCVYILSCERTDFGAIFLPAKIVTAAARTQNSIFCQFKEGQNSQFLREFGAIFLHREWWIDFFRQLIEG